MVAHMPTTPPGDLPYEGDYDQGWHSAHPQLPPGSERAYKAGCRCQACNGEQAGREFAALMDTLADTAIHGRAGWRPLAACRNVPVEDRHIFLTEEGGQSARLIARAKQVCAECPVIAECLLWWLENPDRDAIYAGAGGKDQRALRFAYRAREHTWGYDEDCACRACVTITNHIRRVQGDRTVPVAISGERLTVGTAGGYNKGLRDKRSTLAKADLSQRESERAWPVDGNTLAELLAATEVA